MPSERFNGVKINMDKATDEEVMGVLDHSLERMYRAEGDVQRAMGYASMRGLIPSDIHVDQLQLEFEDGESA